MDRAVASLPSTMCISALSRSTCFQGRLIISVLRHPVSVSRRIVVITPADIRSTDPGVGTKPDRGGKTSEMPRGWSGAVSADSLFGPQIRESAINTGIRFGSVKVTIVIVGRLWWAGSKPHVRRKMFGERKQSFVPALGGS